IFPIHVFTAEAAARAASAGPSNLSASRPSAAPTLETSPWMNPASELQSDRIVLIALRAALVIWSQEGRISSTATPIGPVRIASSSGQFALIQFQTAAAAAWIF